MPTYAYVCTECSHAFDAVQKFSDDALTTCPECGGRLRKSYGSIGVSFKGSGFYRNDSRASTSGAPASKVTSAASSSADGGSAASGSSNGSGGSSAASGTNGSSTPAKTAASASGGGAGAGAAKAAH